MKCPYCNEDLKEWDGRLYCANELCLAKQEDLPKFIWQDLINGKKAQRKLRKVKDRCVKKVKAKEREIENYLNGICVRSKEIETLHKQLQKVQDALIKEKTTHNILQERLTEHQKALEHAIGVLDSLTEIGWVGMEVIKIKKKAGIKWNR